MTTVALKPTSIDFDATMQDLRSILAANPAWTGNLDNQTGTVLLNLVATVNVFAQQKILRALQEAFPDTAVSDRSHYSLASLQGVRLRRKMPASAQATLTSSTAISIPPYTQFTSSGVYFFNRESIFLFPLVPQTITLHEGVIRKTSVEGLSSDYQMYVPFEAGFVVSDEDVVVKVNGNQIDRTTVGIWDLRGVPGYEDRTMPDGRLAVVFGTSVYGTRPKTTDSISVTYAVTSGLAGNNAGLLGGVLYTDLASSISGNLTTALSGGSDQVAAYQYKNIASQTFGTFGAAVTKRQYKTMALQFPGIVDVVMFSQREVNPSALQWMNLIKVVPLTTSGWNIGNTEALIDYLQDKTMYSTRFYVEPPTASPSNVSVRLYCYNWANLTEVKQAVTTAVTNLFRPRSGYIDYDIYKSDIGIAVKESHSGIEYFELLDPTEDLIISAKPVSNAISNVTGGTGSLPVGVYYYGIGVNVTTSSGPGYIKPKSIVTANATAASSSVALTWDPSPNAVSYVVYGRDGTGLYELATVPAGTHTFIDSGTLPQGAVAPSQDTYPVQYLTLNNLTVTTSYSNRQRV